MNKGYDNYEMLQRSGESVAIEITEKKGDKERNKEESYWIKEIKKMKWDVEEEGWYGWR